MYKRFLLLLCLVAALCLGVQGVSEATVVNGDFSSELVGWMTAGDTDVDKTDSDYEAVLKDQEDVYSLLYQGVTLLPGMYTLELDFKNAISSEVPVGTFDDFFAASLYFIDDLSSFDLDPMNPVFDDAMALFDLDGWGEVLYGGSICGSPKGAGWTHYSISFQNNYQYVIPTFELFDGNWIGGDSRVFLDNITITQAAATVPEPATLMLLATGLTGLAGVARRRKR